MRRRWPPSLILLPWPTTKGSCFMLSLNCCKRPNSTSRLIEVCNVFRQTFGLIWRKIAGETYQSARSWINALQREVRCVLLPLNARYGDPPPKEILIGQAAGFLTDDVLQRELKYER